MPLVVLLSMKVYNNLLWTKDCLCSHNYYLLCVLAVPQ